MGVLAAGCNRGEVQCRGWVFSVSLSVLHRGLIPAGYWPTGSLLMYEVRVLWIV